MMLSHPLSRLACVAAQTPTPALLDPIEVLLPWTARGASLVLSDLRGDGPPGQRAGWPRKEVRRGAIVRFQPALPDVLRLAFAGLHRRWAEHGRRPANRLNPLRTPIDLLQWAEHPLGAWPVDLGHCPYDLDVPIIERASVDLTDFGEDLARACEHRLDAKLVDEAVFDLIRSTAAENPDIDAYGPLRRFLIEHPILLEGDFRAFRAELPSRLVEPARALLDLAYRPWAAGDARSLWVCGRCRNLLAVGDGPMRCLTAWCAAVDGGSAVELPVPPGSKWYEQRRGVRLYIGLPGLAELDLAGKLDAVPGMDVELWPGPPGAPDAYDLAVRFDGGETWAVDVKDHTRPFRLGDTTDIPTVSGTETRRILAVPAWRMARPDYRNRARTQGRATGIELLDSEEVINQARRKAGGPRRPAAG